MSDVNFLLCQFGGLYSFPNYDDGDVGDDDDDDGGSGGNNDGMIITVVMMMMEWCP